MSIVQALLTSLCARGWSVTVNQAGRPNTSFRGYLPLSPVCLIHARLSKQIRKSARTVAADPIEGGRAERGRGGEGRNTLMDVRLPKIETPYVDDETGSLPVADFRESVYPSSSSSPPGASPPPDSD